MHGSILPEAYYTERAQESPELAARRQGSFQALMAGVLTPIVGGGAAVGGGRAER